MRSILPILAAVIGLLQATPSIAQRAPAPSPQAAPAAAPPDMPDLARAHSTIRPFSATEIDRVSGASGLTDCFWVGTLSPQTFNILLPDSGAVYWVSQFRVPEGARLDIRGEYPHARYLSFNSYNPAGQPVDNLNDQQIEPDAGSTNPFLPGADRRAENRAYSITVKLHALQAGVRVDEATRPRNTLFVPGGEQLHQIYLRVYAPDQGRDAKGGVMLPRPLLTLADGRRFEGEAMCREIAVKDGAVKDLRSDAEGLRSVMAVPGARAPFHPAQPAPVPWHAYFNSLLTLSDVLINTPYEAVRAKIDTIRTAGFYSTLDNVYMSAFVDNRYGDALVIRGLAPRTPRTAMAPTMDADIDLRYWSVCKYRSAADGAVEECAHDEQIPLDGSNHYIIAITTPQSRPDNARSACGVTWLRWGIGDGIGNPHGGMVLLRHMLPAASFSHSLFATRAPGQERAVLGPYYPETTYETKAAFEARGCPAN
jgi:hypothetical protein